MAFFIYCCMFLTLHPHNPQQRNVKTIVDCLLTGGVIVYPTDTIYGLGCDIFQHKAIERICQIKQINPEKAQLSFVCYDLSDLSRYTKSISTPLYRVLKNHLPGPIRLSCRRARSAENFKSRKNTIGLRVPDNLIARTIVKELGHPVLSTSLPGENVEEYTDPEIIYEHFKNQVDIVIDGGAGSHDSFHHY